MAGRIIQKAKERIISGSTPTRRARQTARPVPARDRQQDHHAVAVDGQAMLRR